jgi:hypothetical protein
MAGQKKMITVIEERIDGHCFSNCSISTMLKLNELLENGSIKKDEIFPDYTLSFDDLTTVTLSSMIPFEDAVKINKTTSVQRFIKNIIRTKPAEIETVQSENPVYELLVDPTADIFEAPQTPTIIPRPIPNHRKTNLFVFYKVTLENNNKVSVELTPEFVCSNHTFITKGLDQEENIIYPQIPYTLGVTKFTDTTKTERKVLPCSYNYIKAGKIVNSKKEVIKEVYDKYYFVIDPETNIIDRSVYAIHRRYIDPYGVSSFEWKLLNMEGANV